MAASLDIVHFLLRSPHKDDGRPESKRPTLSLQCESNRLHLAEIPVNLVESLVIGSRTSYTPVFDSSSGKMNDRMTPIEYCERFSQLEQKYPGLYV